MRCILNSVYNLGITHNQVNNQLKNRILNSGVSCIVGISKRLLSLKDNPNTRYTSI